MLNCQPPIPSEAGALAPQAGRWEVSGESGISVGLPVDRIPVCLERESSVNKSIGGEFKTDSIHAILRLDIISLGL